jgi:MtaA/CmuA family methyltransferase
MTPHERISAAMRHEAVDRVPVMCQMAIGHICTHAGVPPIGLWHDTDVYVDALFALRAEYGFDGILVSVPGSDPAWRDKIASVDETRDGSVITWRTPVENHTPYPLGTRTLYVAHDLPAPLEGFVYASPDDLRPADIETLDPVPDWMLAPVREVIRRSAGHFSVHGETFSPFDTLVSYLGIEQAMLALVDSPDLCRAMLDRGVEYGANWGVAQIDAGVDAVKISSPYVGGGLLSPRFYDEFVVPYEARLVERLHAAGPVMVYTHTCGAIGDRLERMVDTGVDGIECLDPPPLGNVDLTDAKRRIGGRAFIKGNIDSVNTLLRKSGDGLAADVRACLAAGAPGGGFILSTACSIAPSVPPDNIRAMVEIARQWPV